MATTRQMIKKGLKPLEKTPSGRSAGPEGKRSDFPWIKAKDWKPPKAVQSNAEEGLALRAYNEDVRGLKRPGGTDIGVARAVQLSSGKPITPRAVKRIAAYFSRHQKDKQAKGWGDFEKPSPGFVAWLLWGGDEAWSWASRLVAMMKQRQNPEPIILIGVGGARRRMIGDSILPAMEQYPELEALVDQLYDNEFVVYDMEVFPERGDAIDAITPATPLVVAHHLYGIHRLGDEQNLKPNYFYNRENHNLLPITAELGIPLLVIGDQPKGSELVKLYNVSRQGRNKLHGYAPNPLPSMEEFLAAASEALGNDWSGRGFVGRDELVQDVLERLGLGECAVAADTAERALAAVASRENPVSANVVAPVYHGSPTWRSAKSILEKGIKPKKTTEHGPLSPVEGAVYVTPSLRYAIVYALGGDFLGRDVPPRLIKKNDRYGYLFEIPGERLGMVQPDEDSIGEMLYHEDPEWLVELAEEELEGVYTEFPEIYDEGEDLRLLSLVYDGQYPAWAEAGRTLVPLMTENQMLELIDRGANIAHLGPLTPSNCWRIDRRRASDLEPSGSNFFEVAESCVL